MDHADLLVDIINDNGAVLGTKKRKEIDKQTDLYHTIFIQLVTPDQKIILSRIPARTDLPNLYAGCLGTTVATIRRHEESPDDAAARAVKNELGIENIMLTALGDSYNTLSDGHKKYMSVYYGVSEVPPGFSHKDIEALQALTRGELSKMIGTDPDSFTPPFLFLWQKYHDTLLPE